MPPSAKRNKLLAMIEGGRELLALVRDRDPLLTFTHRKSVREVIQRQTMLFVWFEIKKAPGKLGSQGGKGFRSSPGAIGRFRESTSCRIEPILSVAICKSYQASLLNIRVKHPAHDPRKTSKMALLYAGNISWIRKSG